ncbi:MAG: hemolysin family protein [Bryobacteraceae bacterium]
MTLTLLAAGGILAIGMCLAAFVQLLYQESLRLRPRDLPATQFLKETLEPALGMRADTGALTFSLIKHSAMALIAVVVIAATAVNRPPSWQTFLEAGLASWLVMFLAAYLVPFLLYRRTRGVWLSPLVPALRLVAFLVRPLVLGLNFLQSMLSPDEAAARAEETPAENIEALISAGAEEGLIEEGDRKLIQSVVEFGDTTVREVMTPRPNLVAIAASATLEQLRRLVIHEQYSRIPVYETAIDEMVGFVHVRDMFELDEETRAQRTVREILRPIRLVPETKRVQDLLTEMQQDNTHLVIVVDEYGNTAGLASMEDLVEVIVGEIRDEHEPGSDVTPDGAGGWLVSGSYDVAQLAGLLEFRPAEEAESTTVGGLVTEWLGHVPAPGEHVERDGIRIEVLASNGLRVEQVRIQRPAATARQE